MSANSELENMVLVEEYAKKQIGVTPEMVIDSIRQGTMVGRKIDQKWYVKEGSVEKPENKITKSIGSRYETGQIVPRLVVVFGWVIVGVSLISGFIFLNESPYLLIASFGLAVSGIFLVATDLV